MVTPGAPYATGNTEQLPISNPPSRGGKS